VHPRSESTQFDLFVRGEIPSALAGSLLTTASRRNKERTLFSRWHDSQADLIRLDLVPGKPGRIRAFFLSVDPYWKIPQPQRRPPFYATQPNHGLNAKSDKLWATNLLFGAPLEIDIPSWKPRRLLRRIVPDCESPQISSTSHFAWSPDQRYAYYHQSLLNQSDELVRAKDIAIVRIDCETGSERMWKLLPPSEDSDPCGANFHSAFCYEEYGRKFIGLLRTGAILESLKPHMPVTEHEVVPMTASTIWIAELKEESSELQATLLPGIRELGGLALSHLDIDATGGDGFVLYANYKQADVAEETHGINIYGEHPSEVSEHYSGMTVEALNFGLVLRYEKRSAKTSIRTFNRPYQPGRTSQGHSWLPINIQLDSQRKRLFCSFSGFRPRLLPQHIAKAYPDVAVDPQRIRYVPPLLMRFEAETLVPDYDKSRTYLSYTEPMAFCVAGDASKDYICTFSTETGLRIYLADDLSRVICHAVSPLLMNWRDSHFRPDPAHLVFSQTQ